MSHREAAFFWGTDWLMNTSLGGRPGNSQTNDFIISAWYSGSMLRCGRVVECTCLFFPVSIWKTPQPPQKITQDGVLKSWCDDAELMLTVYRCTFSKLTKQFPCEQPWCWFRDEDPSSNLANSECKDFLIKTLTLVLRIRESWIPVFPPARDQNHYFLWTAMSPRRLKKSEVWIKAGET